MLKASRWEFGFARLKILLQPPRGSLPNLIAVSPAVRSIELKSPIVVSHSLSGKPGRGIRPICAEGLRIEESFQPKEWFFKQIPGERRKGIARDENNR
jgi:hypothetical protein